MSDVSGALNSPVPFTAANGKTYLLRAPGIGALETLENWVKMRPLRALKAEMAGVPHDVQAKLYSEAIAAGEAAFLAMKQGKSSETLYGVFTSLDGVRQMFRACAREDHGLIQDDELAAAVTEKNVMEVLAVLNRLMGDDDAADPTKDSSPNVPPKGPTGRNRSSTRSGRSRGEKKDTDRGSSND